MEENIHDDKLDDYVRQSFEDYEESPPADMWGRVAADLEPSEEAPLPLVAYRRFAWQAIAATVILLLLSTLVCEHYYYEEKLRVLSEKVLFGPKNQPEKEKKANLALEKTTSALSTDTEPASRESSSAQLNPKEAEVATANELLEKKKNKGSVNRLSRPENATTGLEPSVSERQPKTPEPTNIPQFVKGSSEQTLNYTSSNFSEKKSQTLTKSAINNEEIVNELVTQVIPETTVSAIQNIQNPPTALSLFTLPTSISPLQAPAAKFPAPALVAIRPHQRSGNWYLGVHTSVLNVNQTARTPKARPGRLAFANEPENTRISSVWWLKTGKKLNAHFFLETGLGYQEMTHRARHTARFRYRDGILQGQNPLLRNFEYDLNTYGGTAEVSMRMEQTTPGTPPSDDDPIILRIRTEERTAFVRIPLLLGYKLRSGCLSGVFKAGLLGNFVLENKIDITTRTSQHPRLRPVAGAAGYTVDLNPEKFFLGYWVSAGAEFKLGKHLSILAEPAFMGDFPRNDSNNRQLPERFYLGLNVGVNYYF
jgi:hypothetical protein